MRYLETGAPVNRITICSDGGGCLPVFNKQGEVTATNIGQSSSLISTLQDLLGKGVTLAEALPAFTSNVADLLRLHDRGRIAPGNSADLLVLDEDGSINDVMIAGIWHVRDGEQLIFGQFESTHDSTPYSTPEGKPE